MAHVVAYSHVTTANIPQIAWDEAWFSLQSWKGYLQSFPGFSGVRLAARALDNGDVRCQVITLWEYPEQLEAWRESQWSAESLLTTINQPTYELVEETFEDFC